MAKPKLALIPAAQGSKLFSVLPSSGVGDFDFTRSGSATRINSQGLIEEVANGQSRLNYPMIDGKVVGCPHHILEPQRLQLVQYSEDFSQSAWAKISITTDSNSSISPDGTLNATKITKSASNSLIRTFITTTGANAFSVYVKKGTLSWVRLYIASDTESAEAWFNLENGTIGHSSGNPDDIKIVPMDNDWYRCIVTKNTTNITNFRIYPSKADDDTSGTSGDIYIWGAQVENGSYPTSYIPTNGSTTTRQAETCNGAGDSAIFNDSEGVLMVEGSALTNIGSFENISLSNGSSASRVFLFYRNSLNLMEFRVTVNNSIQMVFQHTIADAKSFNKMLIKYKQNDFAVWINGFELHTDNSGITFGSYPLTNLSFDNGQVSSPTDPFKGKTKQVQYYNSALTDSELEQLTSWTSFTDMAEGQLYSVE